ncbi:MedA [Drechmeria coniospora]|uniref:MedA n=1 Tax=Drechmeria coniospora TaxID=98403 RepID=A0A151GMJ6_DRECN|nr:MedA [Drechmeria coniospora]KYK58320.1 MedA [Drechmeria coniospora]
MKDGAGGLRPPVRLVAPADEALANSSDVSAVAGYDSTRYQDPSYEQYPAPSYPSQQTDKFAQLNQQSFASNNAVAQYVPAGPTLLSCQPTSGVFGTKVFLRLASQYDLFSMSSPMPYFSLSFGSEKCPVEDVARETHDGTGFVYSCSADAPQPLVAGCGGHGVPLSLVIEGPSGEEISRTDAGSFQYLEGPGDALARTGKMMAKHDAAAATAAGPQDHEPSVSPKTADAPMAPEPAASGGYDYSPPQGQYANDFPQGGGDMMSSYRSANFTTDPHYHHRRSTPAWSGYGGPLGSTGRSTPLDHGRPSLTPLPMATAPAPASGGAPQLIRTSTIANGTASSGPYHSMSLYSSKAVLKIHGKLDSMAENWTQEEWDNRRRIVVFRKTQTGSTLSTTFGAVSVNERPPNSICVSCIWWAEKSECYVTSVDTIHLLEQLVAAPNRFSVEEKNRIRRNLEGFRPMTVSKAKPDSEEFFKIIMGFPNPKPRNIEKDVKVFPWKILEPALKKIIGKYSASPSSTLPPTSMMTPVSAAPYAPLPTPPGQGMASQQSLPPHHGDAQGQYAVHGGHHDSIPSPRSLSGSQASWTPYTTTAGYSTSAARTMSPNMRNASPQQHPPPPMRINTNALPAVSTYDARAVSGGTYGTGGLHTPISHHPSSAATPPRWDATSASYPDGYPGLSAHHAQAGAPVYGANAYGDGAPRA